MLATDIWSAFQKGKELANAATWKNRGIAGNVVFGFLSASLAVAAGFGYKIDVDPDTLQAFAGGIAAAVTVVNAVLHVVTSSKVGISEKQE